MRRAGYQFGSGSRFSGGRLAANRVGQELDKLQKSKGGALMAEDVVKAARRRASPLHRYFTWNVPRAAEKQWFTEARELLRSIDVIYIDRDRNEKIVTRAFVNFRRGQNESQPYITTSRVLNDQELRERWIQQALEEAEQWMARYQRIKELDQVFAAIKRTRDRLRKKRRRAAAG